MSSESDFVSCSESDGDDADGGGTPPPLPSRGSVAPPLLPPRTDGAFAGVSGGDDSSDDDGPPIVPSRSEVKVESRTFVEPSGINYAPFEMMQARDEDDGSMMFADHCWGQPPSTSFTVRGESYTT